MYTYFLTKKRAERHRNELLEIGVEAEVVKRPGKWAVYYSEPVVEVVPVDVLADDKWGDLVLPDEKPDGEYMRDEFLAELDNEAQE